MSYLTTEEFLEPPERGKCPVCKEGELFLETGKNFFPVTALARTHRGVESIAEGGCCGSAISNN